MTTTGDLFVNIKGNNQGFKRTLDQTNRQMNTFAQKATSTMGNIPGLGPALGAGAAAVGAGGFLLNARRIQKSGQLSSMMDTMRAGKRQIDGIYQNRRHAAFNGDIGRYRFEHAKLSEARAHRRETIEKMKGHRDAVNSASNTLRAPLRMLKSPMFVAAAAGAVTSMLVANGMKWTKRVNEATNMYGAATIKNRARLDKKNLLKDIALGKDPAMQRSTIMRQNAADYRRNSGGDKNWAQIGNVAGSAWDYLVGWSGNVLTGSYVPDIGSMTTEQRLAKIQGGAI